MSVDREEFIFGVMTTGKSWEEVVKCVEIVGPNGTVHYRRPEGHPDIDEALRTRGYHVRRVYRSGATEVQV